MAEVQTDLVFDPKRPQTFFQVVLSATTAPQQFFAELPPCRDLAAPLIFLLLANIPPALPSAAKLLSLGWSLALWDLLTNLGLSLARGLAFAVVLFFLTSYLFKAPLTLLQAVTIVCYGSGLGVLNFVPGLLSTMGGPLIRLFMVAWVLYIITMGLRTLSGIGGSKAAFIMLIAILLLSLISAGIYQALDRLFVPPLTDLQ